jgi:hypothetical protein
MTQIKACKQAGCPVGQSGECLESLSLDECPHFYYASGEDDLEPLDDAEGEPGKSAIPPQQVIRTQLFSANELTLAEIPTITQKYNCKLVVILGDLKSGKTTLLGTMFDLFQLGHFEQYIYGGSLTQKGFEVRSHLARIASGRSTPETERTKTLEFRVLHLGVKVTGRSNIQHLLLSDVSGETIRQARNSSTLMKKQLSIAKSADHLFYILDGEQLTFRNRAKTLLNAELFIQSAINNGIFTTSTVLNILISKWDKIKNEEDFNLDEVTQRLNNRFSNDLKSIAYSKMASRPDPDTQEMDLGYGVSEFLSTILTLDSKLSIETPKQKTRKRFFDKFQVKAL